MVKGLLLLTVLLIAIFTMALMSSQETQIKQQTQTKESLKFYPHTYDQCPELPSPYTAENGTEIVVAITKDNEFVLIPVTVEKGESLGYRESEWDKISILEVDAEDFPTLARTGLHSEIELNYTRWITGLSIAEITDSGRPGASSGEGFMSQDEDIISVLKGDNRLVKKLGLTHPQLAKSLFHVWNLIRWASYSSRSVARSIDSIEPLKNMLRNKEMNGWPQYRIEWHQRRIAWALEKIPSDKAVKSLIVALKDTDEEVRMWAAEALKRIGTPEALKTVEKYKKK